MGIDIWEVTDAAATKPYGYMPFYPGPGIGGHCIPLDPVYLSWKAKSFHFYNRFIELASDVNDNMPRHVIQCVSDVLNLEQKSISGSKILCLGMAYKKDINDSRESPSLDVMQLLEKQGATVEYNDPFVPQFKKGCLLTESVILTKELINNADCVLLLTNHSQYDYNFIAEHAKLILDTRNAFKGIENPRIFRIGSPLPSVKEWNDAKQLTVNEAAATKDKY
jgi:UDP-N-acetyl-D-glucosamine dehydrogenase